MQMPYNLLADLVLVIHALVVLFITGGMALILIGASLQWKWIRNFWFRVAHLTAIAIVALQSWLEVFCPLTSLEMYFRRKVGQTVHDKSFVAYWLHELLYYEASFWVFSICYTLFGLAVLLAWLFILPLLPWKRKAGDKET